ncbi:MAG: L-seryl-tRNA(Sec) selenium transferase [Porticoccaceae bacterium]|nr:L-seryl-tRNA(Sec) selenium transferase [Porticoccaceae bacterium]
MNLTGTVLHTNLGRAVLPRQAIDAMAKVAAMPTNLEYDLASGGRGERDDHVEGLICELIGTEAATVVNNNAAALLLVLNTLAENGEIPVSRGELVEIGGSFRVPDIMQRSGCILVEVGTTNRTHLKDYAQAINSRTALLMKVHCSNYAIEGFTAAVDETELAALARRAELPFVVDLGSGNLIDLSIYGLPQEPITGSAIEKGADVVTFSGDKLLGGPQCGIIAGRKSLIDRIRSNPLKRALRVDKMILAALSEVLKLYRHPEILAQELPTLRFLTRDVADIEKQALQLAPALAENLPQEYNVVSGPCLSQIGSGALPIQNIPSFGLFITGVSDAKLRMLSQAFRSLPYPVVGRINDKRLIFDLRCLDCQSQFLEQSGKLKEILA